MECPKRRQNRLAGYDYSQNGAYFITICTEGKKCILGTCRGAQCAPVCEVILSDYGKIADEAIKNIPEIYPMISLEKYVIMPNHIHLLLLIQGEICRGGSTLCSPTISKVVKHLKERISKQSGVSFWQRSFHDHIVRDELDYEKIWEYIDGNPLKWEQDCFYIK